MISCILLSAGLSQRFGSPKALTHFKGESVIGRLQKMLVATQVDEIITVLGAHADLIKPHLLKHTKIKFVYNKDYIFGQTSSFKVGLRGISESAQGILLLPVDYPAVREDTINMLVKHFLKHPSSILIPSYNGKKGHPPLFAVSLREEFLSLDNKIGINSIARAHQAETVILPVEDSGIVTTFNTQEELKSIMRSG